MMFSLEVLFNGKRILIDDVNAFATAAVHEKV